MHRKLFIFSLIFTTSLLTSCSSLSDEDKMSLIKNGDIVLKDNNEYEYDEFTKPIDEDEILTLLDNKEDFILYNAMNSCSACQTVKPIVLKYVLQTSALLRHIDTATSNYAYLIEKRPDIFNTDCSYSPMMFFFKDGKKIFTLPYDNMTSSNKLSSAFSSYCYSTNITSYEEKYDNYDKTSLTLFYFEDGNSSSTFNTYIKESAKFSSTKVNRINVEGLDEEEVNKLKEEFNISSSSLSSILLVYKDSTLLTSYYPTQDILYLEDIVDKYL